MEPRTIPSKPPLSPAEYSRSPPPCPKGFSYGDNLKTLTEGDKAYSIRHWIVTCFGHPDIVPGSEEELRDVQSVPIKLKGTYLKPDRYINSILKHSETLKSEKLKSETTGIPPITKKGRNTRALGKFKYQLVGKAEFISGDQTRSFASFHMDRLTFTNDGADFILLVPTNEIVSLMSCSDFGERFGCVLLSADGPPEVLIKMAEELDLPVLALLSTNAKSLRMLAYFGRHLKKFKWLGVRPTEMVGGLCGEHPPPDIPSIIRPLTDKDNQAVTDLLADDYMSRMG